MLEFLLCSSLTILPDFLYRRYAQGKRIGREITLFSMWYELRWGITACVLLTLSLITVIFYFHPSTSSAISYFRTVPVLPETAGRVAEVLVGLREEVKAGTPLFRLDSSEQQAAVETARRRMAEIEAEFELAQTELEAAEGRIQVADGAYQQALDELETRSELRRRNPDTVPQRQIEQLQVAVDARQGALDEAHANKRSIERRISSVLPAQKATAQAELEQAEVELAKTTVYADVTGRLEQFTLRPGDIVNRLMRPAGILIPSEAGRIGLLQSDRGAGDPPRHGRRGRVYLRPLQDHSAGRHRGAKRDRRGPVAADRPARRPDAGDAPGAITAYLEPLFQGGLDALPPGSSCVVNAYTSNHDRLESAELGAVHRIGLHMIDAVGVVHAAILRLQAILLPVRTLVLSGGH